MHLVGLDDLHFPSRVYLILYNLDREPLKFALCGEFTVHIDRYANLRYWSTYVNVGYQIRKLYKTRISEQRMSY